MSRRRIQVGVALCGTLGLLGSITDLRGQESDVREPALAIHDDERSRELILHVGPVRLPAHTAYDDTVPTVVVAGSFPRGAWLHGFAVELVDGDGTPLPQGLLHHMGLFAPGERDVFSPVMRRIVAFGRETDPIRLRGRFGYRVERGDSLLIAAAFFNPTPEAREDVHLQLRISYAPAHRSRTAVLPLYLDVLPAGHRVFDVPPGGVTRSWDWSPAIRGRVVGLGGHLHQHGVELVLEDVTREKVVWTSRAIYDDRGELVGLTRKRFGRGIRLRPEHVYRLTAVYDNPTDQPVRGAMGKIGGAFIPEKGARLPPADRSHPDYVLDLEAMLNHDHEMHGH